MPNDFNLELVGAHLLETIAKDNPQIAEELKRLIEENPDFLDMIGGADVIGTLFTMEDDKFELLQDSLEQAFMEAMKASEVEQAIIAIMLENGIDIDAIGDELEKLLYVVDSIEELSLVKKVFVRRLLIQVGDYIKSRFSGFEIVTVPFEKTEGTTTPVYARQGDAGMDIYANDDYTIAPGETVIVPTGLKVAIPEGYALLIQPRSGLSAKSKLRVANTPGLIDSGYRDEIGVIIENIEPPFKDIDYEFDDKGEIHIKSILHGNAYSISKGDRIAQMRLVKVPQANLVEVPSVENIGVNREGGFGHTGK